MKIIFSWDDGCVHDKKAAELMKKYDIETIFYWPYNLEKCKNVSRVGKFLTMEECVELSKEFEVGSHTMTHEFLTKINQKQAEYEIFESRKLWQDKTGQKIKSFCYPRGYTNSFLKILVKNAGYTDARSTVIGRVTESPDPFFVETALHAGIDRIEYKIDSKNVSWEIYGRYILEKARQTENAIFHVFAHSWEIELFKDWENLESFIKELK